MHGTMMWFNRAKGVGVIQSDGGRLAVETDGFEAGEVPTGRCAGRPVTFRLEAGGTETRVSGVKFDAEPNPRRARLRHGGSARSF